MSNMLDRSFGPVFVVGMNGSGTTMMLDHLGQHPELYAFRIETYVLPYFLKAERKYGDLERDSNFLKLWNNMRSAFPFRRANAGKALDLPSNWADAQRSAAGVFDRIMQEFAQRDGKKRWAEKTPMHVLHIAKLAECFPTSCFIHMVRDGRDCAASDHRRWGRHPAATIFHWKHVVEEGRCQGFRIGGRYLEMRYEDLTNDPPRHMRRACEFVGLEFDERVLCMSRRRPQETGRKSTMIVQNQHRNREYFSDSRLRSLEEIAGGRLAELGYEPRFTAGEAHPSRVVQAWWTIYDAYRVMTRHIRMKMTVQKRMTWPLFFARWKAILRSKYR